MIYNDDCPERIRGLAYLDALKAFVSPKPQKEDLLIAGIWLSFLSHDLQTIYAILYRLADAPTWLLNAEVVPLIVMISINAGMFHVIAPGAYRGTVPPRERMALGVGVGIAVLLIGVLIATRPDIRPMVEWARPYIADWWRTGQNESVPGPSPA